MKRQEKIRYHDISFDVIQVWYEERGDVNSLETSSAVSYGSSNDH